MSRGSLGKLFLCSLVLGFGALVVGWIFCGFTGVAGALAPASQTQDRLALNTICQVQGISFDSPFEGQVVKLRGVVYADFDQTRYGFYMQDDACDHNSNTSNGIFVYLGGNAQVVNAGDRVEVEGLVQEYYGKTEINTTPVSVTLISTGNPLPTPVELAPPFDDGQAAYYFETHESMYVGLSQARVVGPTNSNGEAWVVPASLEVDRVFYDDPQGTGEVLCIDDRGLYELDPQVRVGDQVTGLLGPLDYAMNVYRLQLLSQPGVIPAVPLEEMQPGSEAGSPPVVRLATFNLANLFDNVDDPATEDQVLSSAEFNRRLRKRALAIEEELNEPDILAVQEVENQAVLQALIEREEINAEYSYIWADTPDLRGQDVALLYRSDRVVKLDYYQRQGCTQLVDGLGPDGNGDKYNPQNTVTCDTDGDMVNDGNRLFSRPPLVARLLVAPAATQAPAALDRDWLELYVIVNHWKSKIEDTFSVQYTQPRRIQQAQFVAGLVEEIAGISPQASIIVAGDLNDHANSEPLVTLLDAGLEDLSQRVEKPQRYSYNYQGISQVLDYILARPARELSPFAVQFQAINSDFPDEYSRDSDSVHRSSDHDPFLVSLIYYKYFVHIPLVIR